MKKITTFFACIASAIALNAAAQVKSDIEVSGFTWRESSAKYNIATGVAKNMTAKDMPFVRITAVMWDVNGKMVTMESAMVNGMSLAAGDSAPFSILLKKVGGEAAATVRASDGPGRKISVEMVD